jgi:hypothetical protein
MRPPAAAQYRRWAASIERLPEERASIMRQHMSILWIVLAWFPTEGYASTAIAGQEAVIQRVQLGNHFSCFNLPGVDWSALADKKNNRILHACLRGTTLAELETFDVPDLSERLGTLKKGKLIDQSHNSYFLAQPAIVGRNRQALQSVVEKAAPKVTPIARRAIQEIRPLLGQRQDMIYHITWSGIMDGRVAWSTLENELKKRLDKQDIDLRTGWWIYPTHAFSTGTNTFGGPDGPLIITAQRDFTPAHKIRDDMKGWQRDLIRSSITGKPLADRAIPQSLRDYGLVGADNRSKLFVLCSDSELFPVGMRLSVDFAQGALANLDIQSISDMLEVTPEQALVIAYHDLCYEVLGKLSVGGELTVPSAAETPAKNVRSLVSCFLMTPTKEFLGQDEHQ